MAGSSVTFTRKKIGAIVKYTIAWVSDDAAGTATGTLAGEVVGQFQRFTTVPSGGGTAPTALYDVTLKDESGVDLLNGLGADRSATATESKNANDGLLFTAATSLVFAVAAAGNSKQGTAYALFYDLSDAPL